MKRILFYVKGGLKNNINFSKIGLIIRKLNDKEYKELFNSLKNFILEDKDLELAKQFYDLSKKRIKLKEEQKIKLFKDISNSGNEKVILNIYNGPFNNIFEALTLPNIKKELNNFLIAEIDDVEFNKYFYDGYIYNLLPKIINFSNYIDSGDGDYLHYAHTKMYEYKGIEEDDDLMSILLFWLTSSQDIAAINEKVLLKLEKMFETKNRDFNFSFIMMIDNLFEEEMLVENSVVNKVSFLERLLISKDENKVNAFVLKVGILCNKLFDITNEELSKRLKEIYNVRSMLVHGEINKIIDNVDYYKRIFSDVVQKKQNKYETKMQILWTIDFILDMFLIRVLYKYLEDPNLCEFIKQN